MIRSKNLLTNGQRPLVERHGIGFSPFEVVEDPEIIEAGGQVGVIRVERFLADRQRPFIKRLGLGVLALISVERPEIVEARGNLRIVSSHPFADLERPLVKRLRIAQISHFFVNHGQFIQAGSHVWSIGAKTFLRKLNQPPRYRNCFRKFALPVE